jgi:hypothetical protein
MYDIFLIKGCRHPPKLAEVENRFPEMVNLEIVSRIATERPEFLGLDRDNIELLHQLIVALRKAGAQGFIVHSKYRTTQPVLSAEKAFVIAEHYLKEAQSRDPDLTFGPLQLIGEDITCFHFSSPVREWRQQGYVPGALPVWVDKIDGHIWQDEDFEIRLK